MTDTRHVLDELRELAALTSDPDPRGLPLGLPTRSLARRFVGALRSRGSLARSLAMQVHEL